MGLIDSGLLHCAWSMRQCGACKNGVQHLPQVLILCRQLSTMHSSPHGTTWVAGVGYTGCLTRNKHFKDGMVGFTYFLWEELELVDQQVAIVHLLCGLLG